MKVVESYQCDYCGRVLDTRRKAETHEATCMQNPAAQNCLWCIHHKAQRVTVDDDALWGDALQTGEYVIHICMHESRTGKRCNRAVAAKCKVYEEKAEKWEGI